MSLTPSAIADRALSDIQAAERQMRQQAEATLREYVQLLTAIARHFAGDALEETRRSDPAAAHGWGPAQWNAFFEQYVLLPGQPYLLRVRTWGGEPPDDLQAALKQLQDRVSLLDRQAEQARQDNQRLQQRLKETEAALAKAQADPKKLDKAAGEPEAQPPRTDAVSEASPKMGTNRVSPMKRPPAASGQPVGHPAILEALSGWYAPRRPGRAAQLAQVPDQRWEWQSMALYILASWGISARPEIDFLLGAASGTGKRTTALRGAVDGLVELGLIERGKLALSAPFSTSLIVMRLSEQGRVVCRELGWELVPGDWGQLSKLSETQQLCTLAFTAQARLRGYRAQVLPQTIDSFQADVLVEKDPERSYVLVGSDESDLLQRWQATGKLSIQLGLCAIDEAQRTRAAEKIRSSQLNQHGAATDLFTLLHQKEVSPDKPLWLEIW